MTQPRRTSDLFLVVGFLVAVGGTSAWSAVRMAADEANFPAVAKLKQFPRAFETFFSEHVGGRGGFLMANAALKTEALNVSPTPRVALGPSGWMYYEPCDEIEALKSKGYSQTRAADEWGWVGMAWREWMSSRGSKLLIVVAPDKQSIYPEYLPYARGARRGTPQLDKVMGVWANDPKLQVLDLRGDLRAAKAGGEVYFRTDTHWNPAGSLVGYRSVARVLGFEPAGPEAFDGPPAIKDENDLPRMVSKTWAAGDSFQDLHPRKGNCSHRTNEPVALIESQWLKHMKPEVWQRPDPGLPKAVLVHDSFATEAFRGALAEHFRRLVCVPSNTPDHGVIERERPDVVIWLLVERVFRGGLPGGCPPPSPSGVGEGHAANR